MLTTKTTTTVDRDALTYRFHKAVSEYAAAYKKGTPDSWRTADYLLGRAAGLGEVLFGDEIDAMREVKKIAQQVWAEMAAYDQQYEEDPTTVVNNGRGWTVSCNPSDTRDGNALQDEARRRVDTWGHSTDYVWDSEQGQFFAYASNEMDAKALASVLREIHAGR